MKRLEKFAKKYNKKVGAKFTNSLVVKNNQTVFEGDEMYLSGAPLHVLSMNAMHNFRSKMSPDFHISFSAGITKHNVADSVKCNMKPITSCTDLLTTSGYMRMYDYFVAVKKEMKKNNSNNINQYIINSADDINISDVNIAGVKNSNTIVPQLVDNPRYHYSKNQKEPPKIDSHLVLFDCITCNKCLPVCPNAANFSITTGKEDFSFTNYKISDGSLIPTSKEKFVLEYETQIANLADFCNDCGDCDTYCPEYGGPFIQKPRFFSSKESFETHKNNNGYYFLNSTTLRGCIDGREYELSYKKDSNTFMMADKFLRIIVDKNDNPIGIDIIGEVKNGTIINMKDYYIMKTLFNGIRNNRDSYPARILLRS